MAKIAACLICKNSAATIEAAIESIRPFVDEINVYDTGSTDNTVALLRKIDRKRSVYLKQDGSPARAPAKGKPIPDGVVEVPLAPIRVEKGVWRDDFSWAREQSFAMASEDADWYFWLDDDDVIVNAHHLRELAWTAAPHIDGFVMWYDYARDEFGNNVCQLWRERLIRRTGQGEWVNPVHEVWLPYGEGGRGPNFVVLPKEHVHFRHMRPESRYAPTRNLDILLQAKAAKDAAGERLSPREEIYIGTEYMAHGRFAEAAQALQWYLQDERTTVGHDERQQAWHRLASCLYNLGDVDAAINAEFNALRERDDWAENYSGLAELFAVKQDAKRVIHFAQQAIRCGMPQSMLIINPLEIEFAPRVRLAQALAEVGQYDAALAAVSDAAKVRPGDPTLQQMAGEIQAKGASDDLVGAIMLLRETLVRHDENLKAYHLMENVPYILAGRPEIVKARADQRRMVDHYLHPEEYDRWYREEPKESTVPDEHVPEIGQHIPRAERLLEGLRQQEQELGRKPRLLDLGCNDMWVGCYLWLQGQYVVDGVELNKQSVEKGLKRMGTFGAPGTLYHGNLFEAPELVDGKYDAVSLFEVLEHVPDVQECLDLMESLLEPGGVIYISTPNGAYERGQIDMWHEVVLKGHLRAIPVEDLTDWFADRGTVEHVELQHGDRVTFASYRPSSRRSRITLYAGAGWEPWSPRSINTTGLGGSETALVQVAARLAQEGHRVTVYSNAEPGFYAGAIFKPYTMWDPTDDPDLLVVSRLVHVFDNPIGAKRTALWCHDHSYPGQMTEERASKIDHIVVLSEWQRDRFARLYPYAADRLTLIRNGIALSVGGEPRWDGGDAGFDDRKPRCVYSSSADRGLDVMLEVWPDIRRAVPDAELHVFYGWDVFDRVAAMSPQLKQYKSHVLALIEEAGGEEGGVFMRGRVSQQQLAEEMCQARVWSYPTAFLETSCIGAMEARAAGLAIVTSDLGALHETVGQNGCLIPWDAAEDEPYNHGDEYKRRFRQSVVYRLTDRETWESWHQAARDGWDENDWQQRLADWEALIPEGVRDGLVLGSV